MIVKNRKKHPFTPYFLISEEKQIQHIARSCKGTYSDKQESELKFVNKKNTCKNHLRNCQAFYNEVTSEEYQSILNLDNNSISALGYEDDGEISSASFISKSGFFIIKYYKKMKDR